jgi:hypothetical protein
MMGKLNPGGAKGEEYTQAHSPRHAWLAACVVRVFFFSVDLEKITAFAKAQQQRTTAGAGEKKSKAEAARDEYE